ncbi:hypothetical protein CF15_02945 [Pyrodictium occultum]|uniref:Uncharacterized protein n=1 Tax=Pyrodictium occultum TaxID=2309 RepID=A0A0V8RUP3_PYROC|nr:hypothetical protein [Pyrodictium occultum]KSW11781.1 hypothetical protein CF15_02945 [Pyrodictium occultum]
MSFRRGRAPPREPGRPRREPRGAHGGKPRPMPLPDGRCNPLCPHFRCLNNALTVVRKPVHGRMQRAAYCRWIGDECIGGACQYAACTLKALLPDGTCLYAREKRQKEAGTEDLEKELEAEEEAMQRVERLMRKKGYNIDDELL